MMMGSAATQKRSGDISDAFASLSGKEFTPLDARYAALKKDLIAGREDAVCGAWARLLDDLRDEIQHVAELGSKIIPEVNYEDIEAGTVSQRVVNEIKLRGPLPARGVDVERWKVREVGRSDEEDVAAVGCESCESESLLHK